MNAKKQNACCSRCKMARFGRSESWVTKMQLKGKYWILELRLLKTMLILYIFRHYLKKPITVQGRVRDSYLRGTTLAVPSLTIGVISACYLQIDPITQQEQTLTNSFQQVRIIMFQKGLLNGCQVSCKSKKLMYITNRQQCYSL